MNNFNKQTRRWLIASVIVTIIFILLTRITDLKFDNLAQYAKAIRLVKVILGITLITFVARLFFLLKEPLNNSLQQTKASIKNNNASKSFIAVVITTIFIVTMFGCIQIIGDSGCASCNVYKAIAFIIIMLWLCVFLCYFIWAIYYYNLNMGKTNEEWSKIKEAKNNRSKGLAFNQQDIDDEPAYNPYKDETFGIPKGTVRGMIAFTLLFGAIALLIVSFGMNNEIMPGSFFIDQFEFFKTAFLMMIAFYFGSHSLQYLKTGTGPVQLGNTNNNSNKNYVAEANAGTVNNAPASENKSEIVLIHNNEEAVSSEDGSVPPIVAIDPMATT